MEEWRDCVEERGFVLSLLLVRGDSVNEYLLFRPRLRKDLRERDEGGGGDSCPYVIYELLTNKTLI